MEQYTVISNCYQKKILSFFLLLSITIRYHFYTVPIRVTASAFVFSLQAQQDISSLQKIAGDTGKKLSSLASNFLTDFQDRIL